MIFIKLGEITGKTQIENVNQQVIQRKNMSFLNVHFK